MSKNNNPLNFLTFGKNMNAVKETATKQIENVQMKTETAVKHIGKIPSNGKQKIKEFGKITKDNMTLNATKFKRGVKNVTLLNKGKSADRKSNGEEDNLTINADSDCNFEPILPPDERLQTMEIHVERTIDSISLDKLYDICLDAPDFYHAFKESEADKHDIEVGEWTYSNDEAKVDDIQSDWDQEIYTQKRSVQYLCDRDPKSMGYNLGKPVAEYKETQYIRTEADDKNSTDRLIFAMELEVDGEVMSNAFIVHIRVVGTRIVHTSNPSGGEMIVIEMGFFVQFTKHVLLANQIMRALRDSIPEQLETMVERMIQACGGTTVLSTVGSSDDQPATQVGHDDQDCIFPLDLCKFFAQWKVQPPPMDDVDIVRQDIEDKLDVIFHTKRRAEKNIQAELLYASLEFEKCLYALSAILLRNDQLFDYQEAEDAALLQNSQMLQQQLEQENTANGAKRASWLVNKKLTKKSKWIFGRRKKQKRKNTDSMLPYMNVCISRNVNASPSDFYLLFTNQLESILQEIHASIGSTDVVFAGTERTRPSNFFEEPWSKELFTDRAFLSYYQPTISGVEDDPIKTAETFHWRIEPDASKFVLMIQTSTIGQWYSDLFQLQVRWVVEKNSGERQESSSLKIGVFVEILKYSINTSKIKADLYSVVTANQHVIMRSLLPKVERISSLTMNELDEALSSLEAYSSPKLGEESLITCFSPWQSSLKVIPGTLLACGDQELLERFQLIRNALKEINTMYLQDRKTGDDDEVANFCHIQLIIVQESLDSILVWQEEEEDSKDPRNKIVGFENFNNFTRALLHFAKTT